jgi:hypothetical protein
LQKARAGVDCVAVDIVSAVTNLAEVIAMSKRIIATLLLALVAGCASSNSKEIYFADGSKVHIVSCDYSYMIDCYQAAGDLCRAKGYSVVPPLPGMMMTRGMLIKCNG